jgi:hypothetical protein
MIKKMKAAKINIVAAACKVLWLERQDLCTGIQVGKLALSQKRISGNEDLSCPTTSQNATTILFLTQTTHLKVLYNEYSRKQ